MQKINKPENYKKFYGYKIMVAQKYALNSRTSKEEFQIKLLKRMVMNYYQ